MPHKTFKMDGNSAHAPSAPLLRSCSWVPAASAAPEATEVFPSFGVLLELSFSLRSAERFREFCALGTREPCPPMSRFNSKPCSSSFGWGRALLTTFGLRCNFRCCILGLLLSLSTSLLLSSGVSAVNDKQEGCSHWTGWIICMVDGPAWICLQNYLG